ncbi:hypothetical protein GQ53DRAFT_97169 [Thozetella sp. PMI_491]|nr:hypothetical protein GQ53DRAFT_97169 [Thozetella sp. PMI_491]
MMPVERAALRKIQGTMSLTHCFGVGCTTLPSARGREFAEVVVPDRYQGSGSRSMYGRSRRQWVQRWRHKEQNGRPRDAIMAV